MIIKGQRGIIQSRLQEIKKQERVLIANHELFDLIWAMREEFRVECKAKIEIHISIPIQKPESTSQTTQKKSKTRKKKRSRRKNSCKDFILRLAPLTMLQIITKG